MCSKAGVHVIDNRFRYLFDRLPPRIAAFALFNRQVGHVNNVDAITVLFCQLFIAVHFYCFGIGRINNSEIAVLHTDFQHLKQDLPNIFIILLGDRHSTVRVLNGGAAQHTNLVGRQNIVAQTMLFNISGFSAARCATE